MGGDVAAVSFERVGVEQFCTVNELSAAAEHTDDADSDVDFYRRCLRHVGRRRGVDAPYEPIARAYDDLLDRSQVEPPREPTHRLATLRELPALLE